MSRPILRSDNGIDIDAVELTAARSRHISENLGRYQRMAEKFLIHSPENLEQAHEIRKTMRRKPGAPWTRESLAVLVSEWRALEGDPNGRMYTLAAIWHVDRSTIHKALDRAEAEGLMEPGERRRRPH